MLSQELPQLRHFHLVVLVQVDFVDATNYTPRIAHVDEDVGGCGAGKIVVGTPCPSEQHCLPKNKGALRARLLRSSELFRKPKACAQLWARQESESVVIGLMQQAKY